MDFDQHLGAAHLNPGQNKNKRLKTTEFFKILLILLKFQRNKEQQ